LEASTLTHAQRRGLFARRSPLLKFQADEKLVALTRRGHQHAFDALVERYQARLLGFCRQMLSCTEDAEDVLQEVFVAAYNAMVADQRPIAVRPWLYRIARNRCLNHLRKPTADGQDTMDTHAHLNGVTTLERVQNREEFRSLLADVSHLPETQRSALLLREIDAMSYEEIAQAMDTTVPGVKSLLVRARIALAESSQARQLTCDEVRLELAEAAEGLSKASGPARRHIKGCDPCREFRAQLRSDSRVLAALFPAGPLMVLHGLIFGKLSALFGGGSGGAAAGGGAAGGAGAAGAGGAAGAAGAGAAGVAAAGGTAATGAAVGGAAAAGGAAAGGAVGAAASGAAAAIGTKAAAGLATAAIIAGGAAEIKHVADNDPSPKSPAKEKTADRGRPAVIATAPPVDPATLNPAPGTKDATATPPVTVTVPPEPTDPTATSETGALTPLPDRTGKRKHRKPIASSDSQVAGSTQTGPITTGVEPATCDGNGDGAPDPGTTCSTGGTTTTNSTTTSDGGTLTTTVEEGTVAPVPYTAPTKKDKRALKKKLRRRRASAR
jgi:RNA polymerase sigma factor (sigma-70 family)